MDQKEHGQPEEGNDNPAQTHCINQNQLNQMTTPTHLPTQTLNTSASLSYSYSREELYPHQHIHLLQQQQELQQRLDNFWASQYQEIKNTNFRKHSLSLTRIKKIMKVEEDVKNISTEAPVFFAKACEMFILELTMKAWIIAEENKRRTLQKNDIAYAISRTEVFDFLVDLIPKDDIMEHEVFVGIPRRNSVSIENVPCYYMPPHHVVGPSHVLPRASPPYGFPRANPSYSLPRASPSYGALRIVVGRPLLNQAHYRHPHYPFPTQAWPILKQQSHFPDSDD